MIGGQPKPDNLKPNEVSIGIRRETAKAFQIRKENGISQDYFSVEFSVAIMNCKSILDVPGYEIKKTYSSEEELRVRVLKKIKTLRSYEEYSNSQNKINGLSVVDFLDPELGSMEIVKRLNEIVTELKSFANEDPQALDIKRILELLEEARKLVYE